MNSTSRKNLVSMSKAARLIEGYGKFRRNPGQTAFAPVESFQFSIDAIEDYICYVKSLSGLKGVEVTGIRVVNAIYESNEEESEKNNQQTVLFIPTFRNEKGEDEAFDPLYIEDGIPQDLSKLLRDAREPSSDQNKQGTVRLYSMQGSSEPSSFMNFGQMGKPPVGDQN